MVISKSRIIGWTVCITLLFLAFYIPNGIYDLELTKPLDMISYWGTVATIIGLVVTVSEVLHSVRITTKTQNKIMDEISKIKNIRDASIIGDSISILNAMLIDVDNKNYPMARKNFNFYRIISRPLGIDYLGSTNLDKLKFIDSNLQDLSSIETDNSRQINAVKSSTRELIRKLEEMDPVKT